MRCALAFLIFALTVSMSQASGLRCFDLFAQNQATTAKKSVDFYAEAIDSLNEKYGGFLYQENLTETLNGSASRFQRFRLRKVLKSFYEFDQFVNDKAKLTDDHYALEKLTVKLEKLRFLMDSSVTRDMSFNEKIIYQQARHSLLSQGLANFLFSGEQKPTPSQFKKIMSPIMTAFKDVYFRWTYAMAYMPKLNGAVIPFAVIEKVVLEGYDSNKDLLAPYIRTAQGKAAFNVFSSTYNWVLAGVMAVSITTLAHTTYQDVYLPGVAKAEQMLGQILRDSESAADTDYAKVRMERTLQNTLDDFKMKYGRDANVYEIQLLESIVKAKLETGST